MTKIYIVGGIMLAIFASYWGGGRIAREQCRAEYAIKQNESVIDLQKKIIQAKAKINEDVYNTGTADIRDRLRARYTIRD